MKITTNANPAAKAAQNAPANQTNQTTQTAQTTQTTKGAKATQSTRTHSTQLRESYTTYLRSARRIFVAFIGLIILLALFACAIALVALFRVDPTARTRAITYLVLLATGLTVVLAVFYLRTQYLVARCLDTLDHAINLYRRVANDAVAARRNLDQQETSGLHLDCSLENWRLLGDLDREQFLMRLYGLERDDLYALLVRGGWSLQTMSEQDCLKLGHLLWDY